MNGATWKMKLLMVCSIAFAFGLSSAVGDTIQLRGSYHEDRCGDILDATFLVVLTSNSCSISATNATNANSWETVVYDGTNTYILAPTMGHFGDSHAIHSPLCGLVTPGREYYMVNQSVVRTFVPWITYCLRPQDIVPDRTLLPSGIWRRYLICYGWRWKDIVASPDGSFLASFSFVRDSSLDLDDQSEFMRPTFEYPTSQDSYEEQLMYLKDRKSTPDEWTCKTYACTDWFRTNGLSIPANSIAAAYAYNSGNPFMISTQTLRLESVAVLGTTAIILPPSLPKNTHVIDYRYARRNKIRMYRYAEYEASGYWKPANDPTLLAKANRYMAYGPKMGDYGFLSMLYNSDSKLRLAAVWVVLSLAVVAPLIILVQSSLKQKKRKVALV